MKNHTKFRPTKTLSCLAVVNVLSSTSHRTSVCSCFVQRELYSKSEQTHNKTVRLNSHFKSFFASSKSWKPFVKIFQIKISSLVRNFTCQNERSKHHQQLHQLLDQIRRFLHGRLHRWKTLPQNCKLSLVLDCAVRRRFLRRFPREPDLNDSRFAAKSWIVDVRRLKKRFNGIRQCWMGIKLQIFVT